MAGTMLAVAIVLAARDTPPIGTVGRWSVPSEATAAGAAVVRYDEAPPWAGGTNCSGTFSPGAEELATALRSMFPQITRVYGYACRVNTARPGETSQHGTGRAIDLAIPVSGGHADNELGDAVANWLVAHSASIGVQLIIWDRTIWIGHLSGTKTARYMGPDPHIDHIHVELNRSGAARETEFFRVR